MSAQVRMAKAATAQAKDPAVTPTPQEGPMEGMILVGGRPQMERSDMPTISFESILAIQKAIEKK